MLFSQTTLATELGSWVSIIVQTGAIGVLGYHLIYGLPKMLKDARDAQSSDTLKTMEMNQKQFDKALEMWVTQVKNQQEGAEVRDRLMITELASLRQTIPNDITPKITSVIDEVKLQTTQSKRIADFFDKLSSDPDRFCQAKQILETLLKDKGIDLSEKTMNMLVDHVLAALKKKRPTND